jgi:hypothetical protein
MKIVNYQEINKGAVIAKFDVRIDQWGGMVIKDCAVIQKKEGEGRFVGLPSKQYQAKDGSTKNYSLISFEKAMQQRFQSKCLELISKGEYEHKAPPQQPSNNNLPF